MDHAEMERRRNILNKFYSQTQKQLDRDLAHTLKAKVASLRILLGAFNAGDIDEQLLKRVLNSMGKTQEQIERYIKNSSDYRKMIGKPDQPLSSVIARNTMKILLIDDEYESVGWNNVFDAIFGANNVMYAETKEKAIHLLNEGGGIGIILLDLKLPASPEEGIELLLEIKAKRLDLPVVIFTGEDTIKHQRKCFAEGAFDYFVKEFKEGDKDYLDYYYAFKDIILNAVEIGRKSDIWRDIVSLENDVKKAGPPFYRDVFHYLKKAYYFLTIDGATWLSRMVLSANDITYYAEVVIQCSLALEGLVNKIVRDNRNEPAIKLLVPKGTEPEDVIFGVKLKGLKSIKKLDDESQRICDGINRRRRDCVHPERRGLLIDDAEAESSVRETINATRRIIFGPGML